MNQEIREPSTFHDQLNRITDNGKLTAGQVLRELGIYTLVVLGSLFILGFGYMFLVMALSQVVMWFHPYWQPAYSAWTWVIGAKNAPTRLIPLRLNGLHVFFVLIRVAFIAFILYAAFFILRNGDFCSQNLLCWMSGN